MLLLKHRFHNEHPWGLPGGWVDRGESPYAAIKREVLEETGLEVVVDELIAVMGDGEWVEIFYLCRVPDATPVVQASEAVGFTWVDPAAFEYDLNPRQRKAVQQAVVRRG